MNAEQDFVIGHRIVQLLQTPWDHGSDFSHCNFYIRLDNNVTLSLRKNLELVESGELDSLVLHEVNVTSDFPSYFSASDGPPFPYDKKITNVVIELFKGTTVDTHIVFEDRRVLTPEIWEGQNALVLDSKLEFIGRLAYLPEEVQLVDLWTKTKIDLLTLLNS